jgi:hypothetical protein|nr:Chain D, peptide [synthetic construct]
VVVVVVVV